LSAQPSILVAGIGNVFLGDDAFGVEVVKRLDDRSLPNHVRVVDFGIRGMDLAYALMDGYDLAILVDATPRGGAPGTTYVMELDADSPESEFASPDAHGMDPVRVLQLVRAMGGGGKRIVLVGCEPASLGDEEEGRIGLSPMVERAIDEAIVAIQELCVLAAAIEGDV
jgi:hydrogenase maturation protease